MPLSLIFYQISIDVTKGGIMDQIKAEIGDDIRHLNTNEQFKDILVSLVTNWVGNKITNLSLIHI